MHEATRVILDEHRSLTAVLHALRFLAHETAGTDAAPHYRVLHAMLDYIAAFPEKLHHPKEDQYLYSILRTRSPECATLLDQLQLDHVRGGELIRELEQALLDYERRGASAGARFRAAVDDYTNFHWTHMRREEDQILPLAERVLTESDWNTIAAAFRDNDDPLFGVKPKEELEQLFQRVLLLAPPPIGVGPEAESGPQTGSHSARNVP